MKVSIITPVFNAEKFLKETLQSVLNQTYSDWEMILVDDCSTDGSWSILERFAQSDKRFRIFKSVKNRGSGVARNFAIEKAEGQYIAFLDSDDIWTPNKLTVQVDFMNKNNIAFSHTSYGYINEKGDRIKSTFHVSKHQVSYTDLLMRTEISCLTAIYDCKMIGKYYMTEHRRKQDYALWLNILKSGVKSYPIDQELAFYRQSKTSATHNKTRLIAKHYEFLKETQNFNTFQAIYYTIFWMINGFIRYYLK